MIMKNIPPLKLIILVTLAAVAFGSGVVRAANVTNYDAIVSLATNATGIVTAGFTISAGATVGAYTVNCIFGANNWALTNGFTVN